MDTSPKIRTIEVLIFDNMNLLGMSGPTQAFQSVTINGEKRYEMRFVSVDGKPVRACCGLRLTADAQLSIDSESDDLLIPGGIGVDALMQNEALCDVLQKRAASAGGGRLISICSGALLLAAAGILDGHSATTHWSRSNDTRKFEKVMWDLDKISESNGRVFTSAGVTTGIDLALAIVRSDFGPAVALGVARELVVQLRRMGGQSQYAIHLAGQFTQEDTLTQLIEKVVAQPHLEWTLDKLANTAGMNVRTLSRHFKRDVQKSPAEFVEWVRVDHARGLLTEKIPLKQIASDSGFGDLQRMRRAFKRRFGINVSDYVSSFG